MVVEMTPRSTRQWRRFTRICEDISYEWGRQTERLGEYSHIVHASLAEGGDGSSALCVAELKGLPHCDQVQTQWVSRSDDAQARWMECGEAGGRAKRRLGGGGQ